MTDTFAGIAPGDAPMFVGAQIVGALVGMLLMTWLLDPAKKFEKSRNRA
jgi:hypothetical protein